MKTTVLVVALIASLVGCSIPQGPTIAQQMPDPRCRFEAFKATAGLAREGDIYRNIQVMQERQYLYNLCTQTN